MEIRFEKITNYQEKINLSVKNNQKFYIETIDECLMEANEYDLWQPYKIYDGEEMIAFCMYGQFAQENNSVWLDRFFIDQKHQLKGYFRKIMPILIEKIQKEYRTKEVFLSVYPENAVAHKLYKEFLFVETGDIDTNGEIVMVLR